MNPPLDSTLAFPFLAPLERLFGALRLQQPLPQFLSLLAEQAAQVSGCDAAYLVLKDGYLRPLIGHSHPQVGLLNERDGGSRWVLEQLQPLVVTAREEMPPDLELSWLDPDHVAFLGLPIVQGGEGLGVLYVLSKRPRDFSGELMAVLGLVADLTSFAVTRQRLQSRFEDGQRTLIRFALIDPLTNLASERQFEYLLRREWRRMQADAMPMSLIQLEPDDFAASGGRVGGSQAEREALAKLAALLDAQLFRPNDLTARLGPSRFVMMLPATNLQGAKAIAERVRRDLGTLALPHPQHSERALSLSIGVATHQPLELDGYLATPEDLLAKAEIALQEAQGAGGNMVVSLT